MEPTHIIQFSDTHMFANADEEFGGINTDISLGRLIDHILDSSCPLDAVVVTGDLVQQEEPAAYARLLSHLKRIPVPVYCIAGNHDDPSMLASCLNTDQDRYVAQARVGDWQLIFLNSHVPGTHAGYLPAVELERLVQTLQKQASAPVLICLHHHPVSSGSPWMDGMALENPQDLFAITDQYQQVKGIIWGHIHQEYSSVRNKVQLLGCPSTCAQFLPGASTYARDDRPAGYRRLTLAATGNIESEIIRVA